jgi:hypothetical protein
MSNPGWTILVEGQGDAVAAAQQPALYPALGKYFTVQPQYLSISHLCKILNWFLIF